MKNAYIQLHIAILLAGLTGIFGKLISLNETFLTFYRMLITGVILVLIMFFMKKGKELRPSSLNRKIFLNGILLALHWVCFYGSVKYANISVGVLCFCLTGFFTAILAPIIKHRKLSWAEVCLSGISLLGISMIFHFDTHFRTGIILGILSSIFISINTLLNEGYLRSTNSIHLTTMQMFGGLSALIIIVPIYAHFMGVEFTLPGREDLIYLLLLSVFCTVVSFILLNNALSKIPAFTVNLSYNLEPIYSIFLAIIFFGEGQQIGWSFIVGLSLILLSLGLQTIRVFASKGHL